MEVEGLLAVIEFEFIITLKDRVFYYATHAFDIELEANLITVYESVVRVKKSSRNRTILQVIGVLWFIIHVNLYTLCQVENRVRYCDIARLVEVQSRLHGWIRAIFNGWVMYTNWGIHFRVKKSVETSTKALSVYIDDVCLAKVLSYDKSSLNTGNKTSLQSKIVQCVINDRVGDIYIRIHKANAIYSI